MDYNNLILQGQYPAFGNLLQGEVARRDRQSNIDYERQQQDRRYEDQLRREQKADEWKNLQYLDDKLDPTKNLSGLQKIDLVATHKTGELLSKYSALASQLSPSELMFRINQEFTPVLAGTQAAKNKLQEETNIINAAVAKNKNLNKEALLNNALHNIGNQVLSNNQNGSFDFKPMDKYDLSKSFTEEALNSPDAWKYALGDGGLVDYLKKGIDGKPTELFSKNSDGSMKNYEVIPNALTETSVKPDKNGYIKGEPVYRLKTEEWNTIKDGKNESLKMIPADLFSQHFVNTPEKAMGFMKMFNEYKQKEGLPDQLDPRVEDKYMRKFAYELAQSNSLRQPALKNITHLPRTTININSSSKNAGSEWVARAESAIRGGNADNIKTEVAQLLSGNTGYKIQPEDIKIENGKVIIPYHHDYVIPQTGQSIRITQDSDKKPFQEEIDINDHNLGYKLAGIWQKYTGSDVNVERKKRTINKSVKSPSSKLAPPVPMN